MTGEPTTTFWRALMAPLLLGLLALAWLVFVPIQLFEAETPFLLPPNPPGAPDFTRATIGGVGLTVVATLVACSARRWTAAITFGVFLALNLAFFTFLWLATHHPKPSESTPPPTTVTHCVEHSGGDSDCPGG